MRMVDTQILIHIEAGRRPLPSGGALASVAAKEFLLMYGPHAKRDRYYIPVTSGRHLPPPAAIVGTARERPVRAVATDRMLIDFNNEHPTLIEFGSFAVTNVINSQAGHLFDWGVATLEKGDQRLLRKRFRFLVSHSFRCFALEEEAVALGLDILARFLEEHSPKANFRNTVRDALILGTAAKHGIPLHTEDKLLAKLTAARFGARLHHEGEDLVIDFPRVSQPRRDPKRESKGYINRGWRVATNNARFPV